MPDEKPMVNAKNSHFLKRHASWLYCDNCNKTVAYLCYITYKYFRFSFTCSCGCQGSVENKYGDIDLSKLTTGELVQSPINKRFCCPNDESSLFSPVAKNLESYTAEIVCKKCDTRFVANETPLVTNI